ncbi:MAG: cation:proton antiporter [Candidatus Altiarchaeales archaeon]|nr:cation:proton antiporter [Candidatus Altiarchaeales archaeon]MBD3416958.1 cation:proton antiporter [Candidatus Altiarchaeales archaeon]
MNGVVEGAAAGAVAEGFVTTPEFQMSLLLFVSLLGYIVASRINQSVVIGEIIVGLLIGPSLLGWITYTDFVESLAHLGAVILLFVIGLEFKLSGIYKPKYIVIALAGVIIPWIGGYYVAELFGFDFKGAVFVGTAMTATSIAITANVLKEMGKLKTNAAEAIIGAAVIDDILGLVALAISNQVVQGEVSLLVDVMILLKAVGFLAVGAWLGHTYLRTIIIDMDESDFGKQYPEFVFIVAMMIAFLYSMAAEYMGLSAIVGAFLAGVSLEGIKLKHSKDFQDGAEYLHIIFAAIFFVSLGILVDAHQVTGEIIFFTLVLSVVAVITKVLGCYLAAIAQKIPKHDSLVIGFGMSPRGEVAMIVGLIGLTAGIIDQGLYVAIIFMSLLTTVLTPIVLRNWLYKESTT